MSKNIEQSPPVNSHAITILRKIPMTEVNSMTLGLKNSGGWINLIKLPVHRLVDQIHRQRPYDKAIEEAAHQLGSLLPEGVYFG